MTADCRLPGHVRVSNNGEPERCSTCAKIARSASPVGSSVPGDTERLARIAANLDHGYAPVPADVRWLVDTLAAVGRERDHAIHERVTLAAAQAVFPMRTVEVRPTDAENVACGVCGAAVAEPCRVLLDMRYTRNPHAARRAAAAGLPFDPEGAQ